MSADRPQAPRSRRILLLGLVVAVIAVAVAVTGILSRVKHENELIAAASDEMSTVAVIVPQHGPSQQSLILPGNVTPYIEAQINARVNGYLKTWYTDIGAQVKGGQLMAEIETPELDQQIIRAKADVATAQANLELAVVTARRWQSLIATESVSRQELDEKVGDEKAKLAIVNAARAALDSLRAQQAFNRIVAPFDGVVTDRQTDIGMLINAGSGSGHHLFRVADTSRLRIYVDVPQNFSPLMKPGLTADLYFPELPGRPFPAQLISTAGAIHQNSRTLTVELLMDNKTGELLPGAYAEVHFTLPTSADVFRIPATALIFRKNGMEVATVSAEKKVVLKRILVGRDFGNTVEVRSGLSEADLVIDNPSDSIAEGEKVSLRERHGERNTAEADTAAANAKRAP